MLEVLEVHLEDLRRRLVHTAKHLHGAKTLTEAIYGVGPITALALCCWLGGADRFRSSRQAVRFAGLDVTVHSSDTKRSPGHLSRQGPAVLRWCLYEAGKTSARTSAPAHNYYADVKQRLDGKRAALSQGRRIVRRACHLLTTLGDDAFATVRALHVVTDDVDDADKGTPPSSDGAPPRPAPATMLSDRTCRAGDADGLQRLSGRTPAGGGHPIHHHVTGLGPKQSNPWA
jgi:hypothetical protein